MNTIPNRNVEGIQTVITCMSMKALENKLDRGEKNGDATKVITSGEITEMKASMPKIETKVGTYELSRKAKNDKKRRELQLAIIREQNERTSDDNIR